MSDSDWGGLIGTQTISRTLTFSDNDALRELVGELGTHLTWLARTLDLDVQQRGTEIRLSGREDQVKLAANTLNQLYDLVVDGHPLHPTDVHHSVRILRQDSRAKVRSFFEDTILVRVDGRPVVPRSPGQRAYLAALREHEVVFGVGPAGTGKTYMAMAMAVAALLRGEVKRIMLTRPAVEAGEKLGFLPGDLTDKVDPYLRPLWDALADMLPADRIARLMEKEIVEVAPLAFMRGRTLSNAYVVLDEAQNTTKAQMKMFLTRLGEGSRMVITGDITQIDLPRREMSGMIHALRVLDGVPGIGVVRLSTMDVVRHPLVAKIINAYERQHQQEDE